ncbi:MAG: thiol-activated cytolysin family protein, partial [Bacteroidales bacterium]|nr:thiol-activated cytolysin family protein [Bacteroidales bacterium]
MKTNLPKPRLASLLISFASCTFHKSKSLRCIQLPILVLALMLSCTMCKKDLVFLSEDDVMDVLQNAEKVVPLAAEKDEITETTSSESDGYRYTYEKHDVVDNIESIVYLGLNDDIIWPGNLVKGNKAHDFIYEPISIDREPITISISLESSSTGTEISHEVNDPKLSTVRQGISDLLKKAITDDTNVPAKVEFSYQQVFSKSQMNMFVGADISRGAGSLSTQFDWNQTSSKTRIMAKYKQIYYSIDLDVPQSPLDFFSPSITKNELAEAMGPGSMPLYVAGVSYGMMAIMCIESEYSYEEMKLAIDASYEKRDLDVDLGFGYTAKEVMQNSSIKIIVYGGSTAGVSDLETGIEGFNNVIDASTEYSKDSPGVPLVYKFRHLVDNTLALVTLTSQYTMVSPLQLKQYVKITVLSFECTMANDDHWSLDGRDLEVDRFY